MPKDSFPKGYPLNFVPRGRSPVPGTVGVLGRSADWARWRCSVLRRVTEMDWDMVVVNRGCNRWVRCVETHWIASERHSLNKRWKACVADPPLVGGGLTGTEGVDACSGGTGSARRRPPRWKRRTSGEAVLPKAPAGTRIPFCVSRFLFDMRYGATVSYHSARNRTPCGPANVFEPGHCVLSMLFMTRRKVSFS